MNVRTVALGVVTFVVGVIGAHAQGPPAGGPGAGASLAARIDALEARVAALETLDEKDIAGRYQMIHLGIELNRGFDGGSPAAVSTSESNIVLRLNDDHSVQFVEGSGLGCTLPILALGIVECEVPEEEEEQTEPTTWSMANGMLTISAGDGDLMVGRLAANGVFVAADSSEFQPGHGWAVVFVLSKLAN
jgi:hypothetical protein